jgi:SAM-dependent methyltransferase
MLDTSTIKELIAFSLENEKASFHITRHYMYKRLKGALAKEDGPEKTCLAISHSTMLGRILGLHRCDYREANYPETNILSLPFGAEQFDFCVSDQVFEHIEGDPFDAFAETVRVLKPGGIVCHTTCMINPVHGVPKDFWRYTPDALRLIAEKSGCRVIEAAGWGNREAWAVIELGFRFAPIPDDERHPLHRVAVKNEEHWPISTWVLAEKSGH